MSNLFTLKESNDIFNGIEDHTENNSVGVLLSFTSADVFVVNSLFGLSIKVLRCNSKYLKDYGGSRIFTRGEFKDFLIDADNNLIGNLFSSIKGTNSMLSIKLNNYLLDIKLFEDDLVSKVFDNRGNRIGYTVVNTMGGAISACV